MSKHYIFYGYPNCSTCRKAKKKLDQLGVDYTSVDIKITPPTADQFLRWFEAVPMKRFFNTSGQVYRELQLKDRLSALTNLEAAQLLSTHGMLVKRPLLIKDETILFIGYKETDYDRTFIT